MTEHYHEPPLPFEGDESNGPSASKQPNTPKQRRYRRRPSVEDPRSRQLKDVTRERLDRTPEEIATAQESARRGAEEARAILDPDGSKRAKREAAARLAVIEAQRKNQKPPDISTQRNSVRDTIDWRREEGERRLQELAVLADPDEPSQPWLDEHEWARQDSFKNEDSTSE